MRGSVLARVQALEHLDGLERLPGRCREQPGRGAGVQLLEGAGEPVARGRLWRAQAEHLQVVDREALRSGRDDPAQLGTERHRAERWVLVVTVLLAVAVQA